MTELKLKRTDRPLPPAEAEGDWQTTAGDVARAIAKWSRRMPDLDKRLARIREEVERANPSAK